MIARAETTPAVTVDSDQADCRWRPRGGRGAVAQVAKPREGVLAGSDAQEREVSVGIVAEHIGFHLAGIDEALVARAARQHDVAVG